MPTQTPPPKIDPINHDNPPAEVPLNMIIAGIVIALITFFAGIIGFLSTKQAPPAPPVVEHSTK